MYCIHIGKIKFYCSEEVVKDEGNMHQTMLLDFTWKDPCSVSFPHFLFLDCETTDIYKMI